MTEPGRSDSHPSRDRGRNDGPKRDSDRPRRAPGAGPSNAARGSERGGPRANERGGSRANERGGSQRESIEDRDPFGIRAVRSRHDDPEIPEDVSAKDLDRGALAQLKTLSKENAEGVAEHLVMVARHIDDDPDLAYRHAVSAARRAGRIAVVRETLAIAAYTIGDFAMALREFRTYRRISGSNNQLPMMVDSERGLGRPDRALELGRSVDRSTLPADVQALLAIAMSGARLDLGQPEEALAELEIPQLTPTRAYAFSPDLFAAYATVLEDLGRTEDAHKWMLLADRAAEALAGTSDDLVEVVEVDLTDDSV